MKSFATNLVIAGALATSTAAQKSAVQEKLSLIATEMHHYALMTEATNSDLVELESNMKSFFAQKMMGQLSLAEGEAAATNTENKDTTTSTAATTTTTSTPAVEETKGADNTTVVKKVWNDGAN